VNGAYTDDGSVTAKSNPLSDSRLMKRQSDSSLGYEKFSIGRTVNQKAAPTVQNKGNIQNGQ
jgi:hypothetical protein